MSGRSIPSTVSTRRAALRPYNPCHPLSPEILSSTMSYHTDVYPDTRLEQHTDYSLMPHPPAEDRHEKKQGQKATTPDTGWRGQPAIPSQNGGDYEKDFINMPPYSWKSEDDIFQCHYRSSVHCTHFVVLEHAYTPSNCNCRECWCGNGKLA